MTPNIWRFKTSDEAYDASQCREDIKDGDVLVCDDGVVGVLVEAWPVAVSSKKGTFHSVKPGLDLEDIKDGAYETSVKLARTFIKQ